MKRTTIIGIIIAAVIILVAAYTVSPLFQSTSVNEPSPIGQNQFEQFMAMSEQERLQKGQQMGKDEKDAIMKDAAAAEGNTVNEEMASDQIVSSGNFVGVNDGIHNAEGIAKVIQLEERSVLRLEDFRSTNGPDLYVYLSADKNAGDFVSLGRLKGNVGNQNYEIAAGTDLSRYDTVLVWCQAFSVLFGSAKLNPT